jgi:hypothetical protein
MPAGALVTVPAPVPAFCTVRVRWVGGAVEANVAVTVLLVETVSLQAPTVPESQPLQPTKVEPGAGVAERLTPAPFPNGAAQVGPQLIPAGELVTVPAPVPAF